MQAKRPYFSTVDLLTLAVIAVVGGLMGAWVWFPLMHPAIVLFPFLGPVGWIGISGVFMIAPVLAGLLLCRPGATTLYGVVQGFVEMLFGNPLGAVTIILAGLEGLGADLGLAAFRYKPSLPAAMLAGALGGLINVEYFMLTHLQTSSAYLLVGGVTGALSGALLGGLVAWLLAQALARAGVVNRLGVRRYQDL
jgi:energy-coupling factor transport system permease protein